ncbi:MAG TPA: hypothetical protein DIC52_02490 [Candidatus Latescibacteria bacterium]|nr:hypothetical protein [Candidatus Latescibacterota bacterium]
MSLFTLLRKVHLYSSLVLLTFVVMYFVTGYIMVHHSWFPDPTPFKSACTEPLSYAGPMDPEVMEDGGWRFRYARPGTFHEAVVTAAGDSVHIFRREEDARTTLVGFHRLHGYGGGWLYDIWVVFYDLASLALILFPLTGILSVVSTDQAPPSRMDTPGSPCCI